MKNSKLLLALSGLVALMLHVDATLGATAGYVQFVNGQVSLTTARGATHTLQKGEAINEGDTVSTKQSSSAQIKMQDGGFIAVRPDTQLKFDSFKFTGQAGKPESSFFSLFRGGFRAVTGLIGRINRQDYRITTPAATIGVRGTDHETVYLPTPTPGAQAGAYSKVNIGETSLTTNKGTINVLPNQMGFAGGLNQPPQLQPINTSIFTVATAPTKTIKESKKEERKENGKPEGASQKQQSASEAQDEKSSGAAEPIRDTAVVDNTKLAKNITTTVTTTAATESKTDAAITTTVAPKTELAVIAKSGGLTLNATEQTVTSGGTTVSVQDGIYSVQAKTAADAAQVAADAANSAKIAATNANTTLQVIALADTAPAAAAIATANSNISTATSLVTTALALPAVSAGTAPTTAQNNATTAASQTTAANAAFTANGSFADSTAAPAKTATQTANTALQSANTALQSAATTVSTQNTSLSTAKTAANTAWASANSNLATANSAFSTAGTQNTSITSAQTAATSLLSAAQTAANAAQTAATAAQAAAAQAEALQAAGDLTGAAEHLAIAQNQLAIAQTQRANAQAAQSSLATQLASAQAAKTTASTAVANATSAATVAANAATTAQTQAANASTAATAANTALATVTSQSALVNTNAATVAANAPIAAYNNPAVVTADRFIGVLGSVVTPTAGQHIEGGGPGAAFTGVGTANTSFVLDGSGNLVESRHTWYEESPASTATTQVVVPDANVKRTGGTAAETFKLSDSSIYGGRWTGGSITVTDNASAVSPITRNFGATSEHWAIMLAPTFGYVQALTGTTAYTKAAATSPTDALGNVGVLNTATLSANFTSQLVSAALNLTISGKTFDVQALNLAINGFGFSSAGAISPTCTGCSTTYYAHVGGMFAGNAAASAGVSYTLWAGALPGATTGATDLIQGGVAFSTATPPTLQAFDVAAQTAATAAATAATAAQTAATAATAANTTLTGIATVSTAPATTAISTATTNIGTATTSVSTATALTPANATTAANNATAATAAATSAAAQAAAAQAALTSNGAFADSTATTANTSVQSANTAVQTASTTVQTNATAVTTQNNALNTAQTAATTALDTANTSLTTANSTVGTVTGFNSTITSAQSAAATPLSTAQAAATAAQTAATAAQAAATQAAALQAGGDLIGAQAQLVIAQQQLAIAQSEQSNAIAAQNAVGTQLAAAQAAQTAANTAVTDAANIANSAEAFAVAAQTQAAAANTALAAANTALTTTTNQLAVVNTNAVTVAANAPIAAYNNPAVVSNNFTGHLSMPVPAATSGFDIASEDTTTLKANTTYVLDGNGNLVEMRSTTFNIMPVQSTATTTIANADVKWSGGTAADTFKLPDNSIYGGRWENATLTVTDLSNSAITTYTPASSLWAVLLTPNVGYVQSLVGTTSYNLAGATAPFDTAGNVGTLISASLVADFTSQLVNAAINLTMPAASSMAGTYDISANGMQINSVVSGAGYGGFGGNNIPTVSCTGTCAANVVGGYSADVGGSFAGAGAASAGLGYDLWPTVSVGSPVTDLVQGLVAF
ncbi:MAG: FecR family protein, partial [Sideroxyarcus sp.]|nr:FecR family protein [Sideroxyarcus sp.]